MRAEIRGLLYVRERQIMTLKGEWHRLAFGFGPLHGVTGTGARPRPS